MRNGSDPIFVPRWMLTAKYLILALLGVAVGLATAPSLVESLGHGLSTVWGFGIALAALVAAYGSLSSEPHHEFIERWSVAALAILLLVYAFSPVFIIFTEGDMDRVVYSVTALGLSGLPTVRAIYLLRRTGLNKVHGGK